MSQKYSSKNTSINKLGRLYTWFNKRHSANEDLRVLDYGAGQYLLGTRYLKDRGYDITAYEPNLENNDILDIINYDVILISNVLNVIAEDNIIEEIVAFCKKHSKITYATTYEGNKSGIGKISKNDCWQRNEKTKDYERFGFKKIANNILVLEGDN